MLKVGDLLSKNAFNRPAETAFIDGDRRIDWAEFDARVWGVASALRKLGVKPGDRVAYLGLNSHRLVECYYAPSRAGAIIAPLNYRLARPEMLECVADSTPRVLIADPHFLDMAKAVLAESPSIEAAIYAGDGPPPEGFLSYEALIEAEGVVDPASMEDVAAEAEDTLLLFYTGGTTGRAKGVMLTHRNLMINSIGACSIYGLHDGETHLITGPLFHLGAGSRVFTNVYAQSGSVILPKFDPEEVMQAIETHRINVIVLVPTMVKMMLDHPKFSSFDLSSLRQISYGASPMPLALVKRALAELPGIEIVQGYGQTETSPVVTFLGKENHDPNSPLAEKLASVGKPVPYGDVRIVDEDDNPVPQGQTGEVVLRGPQVMKGYWNQPELTAETFRNGFHHTGDAGYLDEDGYLYLVGRTKEMIISGGENVYPIETENVLSMHPAVAECAVIGLPHEKWGEAVHAVVRLRDGETVDEQALIEHCRERIAAYKCPRGVTFWNGPFPLSSVNKVMKADLRRTILGEGGGA